MKTGFAGLAEAGLHAVTGLPVSVSSSTRTAKEGLFGSGVTDLKADRLAAEVTPFAGVPITAGLHFQRESVAHTTDGFNVQREAASIGAHAGGGEAFVSLSLHPPNVVPAVVVFSFPQFPLSYLFLCFLVCSSK